MGRGDGKTMAPPQGKKEHEHMSMYSGGLQQLLSILGMF